MQVLQINKLSLKWFYLFFYEGLTRTHICFSSYFQKLIQSEVSRAIFAFLFPMQSFSPLDNALLLHTHGRLPSGLFSFLAISTCGGLTLTGCQIATQLHPHSLCSAAQEEKTE